MRPTATARTAPAHSALRRLGGARRKRVWVTAKRVYRFLGNARFTTGQLTQGLYTCSVRTIRATAPAYIVVALAPVNFEKPYTLELEGVSTVHKCTPPTLSGQARLARGYPAMTATVVNTPMPATTYTHWFSYTTDDFISKNW